MKVIFILLSSIYYVLLFDQSDYDMVFERVEFVRNNEEYLTNVKFVTFKYNRTQPAVNLSFTIHINTGNNLKSIVQAYTFLSNEYRTFPMRYLFDICEAINNNDYGLGHLMDRGNFTGCPLYKGSYYLYNWVPDTSKFPPFIPNGRYMFETQFVHYSDEMGLARLYATISRPLGRRH